MARGRTLWEMLLDRLSPVEFAYYNPLRARVGSAVTIDTVEWRDLNFFVLSLHEYRRRIGGYSYRAADVTSTYGANPPPYVDVRQSPGGPFDYGFFFDSAIRPHGGESPYQH